MNDTKTQATPGPRDITGKCGCTRYHYCPMHAAATQMRDALQLALEALETTTDEDCRSDRASDARLRVDYDGQCDEAMHKVRAALAAAGVK